MGAMALGVPALPANAIGYALGLIVSFMLNRAWTFRRHERIANRGIVSATYPTVIEGLTSFRLGMMQIFTVQACIAFHRSPARSTSNGFPLHGLFHIIQHGIGRVQRQLAIDIAFGTTTSSTSILLYRIVIRNKGIHGLVGHASRLQETGLAGKVLLTHQSVAIRRNIRNDTTD